MSRRGPGGRRAGGRGGGTGATRIFGIAFRTRELRDLGIAWVALSVAFGILFAGGGPGLLAMLAGGQVLELVGLMVASFLTAGVGFLLHEVAHKVVAVRFGQAAAFRANYQMLGLAVMVALAGFIYAAPGAVYHSGRITKRQGGLIALAGPVTNVGIGLVFLVPWLLAPEGSAVLLVAVYGVAINFLLAGFNMLPVGPLDGATVRDWSLTVYLATAVPCIVVGIFGFLVI